MLRFFPRSFSPQQGCREISALCLFGLNRRILKDSFLLFHDIQEGEDKAGSSISQGQSAETSPVLAFTTSVPASWILPVSVASWSWGMSTLGVHWEIRGLLSSLCDYQWQAHWLELDPNPLTLPQTCLLCCDGDDRVNYVGNDANHGIRAVLGTGICQGGQIVVLVLNRSPCVIPGFLGTPAGMTTTLQHFRQPGSCSDPRLSFTFALVLMWLRSAVLPGVWTIW